MSSPPSPFAPNAAATPSRGARVPFYVLLLGAAALAGYVAWPLRVPLFLAAVFSVTAQPFYHRVVRLLGGRPRLAAGLVTFLLFVAIIAPFASIIALAVREVTLGLAWMRDALGVDSLGDLSLQDLPAGARHWLDQARSAVHMSRAEMQGYADQALTRTQQAAPAIVGASMSAAADTVLGLIAFYFFVVDGDALSAYLVRIAPLRATQTQELLQEFRNVSRAALLGTALTAVAQAIMLLIGFLLAGVPHAIFFAILTLFASLVPIAGSGLVWAPAVVGLLLTGHIGKSIALAVWCALLVSSADNVVKPLVMRGKAEMHTGLVFLSLFAGLAMFGGIGIIAGPLVIAFFIALLRMYARDFEHTGTGRVELYQTSKR